MLNFLRKLFGLGDTEANIRCIEKVIRYTEKDLKQLKSELRYYQNLQLKNKQSQKSTT